MNSKVFALLLIAVVGVFADEFNCGAEGKVCQNGGICHEPAFPSGGVTPGSGGTGWQTPSCICKAPFAGPDCSYTIRECKDSPCQNGATCMAADCGPQNGDMSNYDCFTCQCARGWTSSNSLQTAGTSNGLCDIPVPLNDCLVKQQCQNGGNCTSTGSVSSFSCTCPREWLGGTNNNCTVPTCFGDNPCQNGGTCSAPNFCTCPAGYSRSDFRCTGAKFCDSNPCASGSTCVNDQTSAAGGRCVCLTSITPPQRGTFCNSPAFCDSNPCHDNPCVNSGAPSTGGFCNCLPNFRGTFCEQAPFCNLNLCQNGATCTNTTIGGKYCKCAPGFIGDHCEIALTGCGMDGVDCAVAHTLQYNSGVANNQQKTCACRDRTTCAPGSDSTNNPHAVLGCQCKAGPDVWAYDCRCNSTYVPRCPTPFGSNSGQNIDMVCQNGATCVEHAGGTMCSCRPGFWGPSCENYDNPCLNNPCQNQGQCSMVSDTGKYRKPDYLSSTSLVSFGNIALDDRFWGYQCLCKWPYYGATCQNAFPRDSLTPSVCAGNGCQNLGVCGRRQYSPNTNTYDINGNFGVEAPPYQCSCIINTNFTGVYCEKPRKTCYNTPDYCMNGGMCLDQTMGTGMNGALDNSIPICRCPCGFAGDRCEIMGANTDRNALMTLSGAAGGVGVRLDFCSSGSVCGNGGTCVNTLDGQDFVCICKSGWADRYCQTRVRSSAAGVAPSILALAAAVAVAFALKN